jgi:flagellar hook-associated protein 1 FlgK
MSLASALSTTKNILSNTSTQTAVLSTNVQNVGNSDYNRRTATITTNAYSGATTVAIDRTQDSALLKQTLMSTSDDAGQQTLLAGLESLYSIMGGDDYTLAPSTALADLRDALQAYAATPGDATLASAAVSSAVDVATSLNTATTEVQSLRADTDKQIGASVDKLNKLLSQFKDANDAVKAATAAGTDANDALDTRESLLKQISEIVGISTVTRSGNDISIYTSDGITLFETTARTVSFDATTSYSAVDSDGNPVIGSPIYIDGVELKAGQNSDSTAQGSLQGLLQLRDEVYPTYQSQLDEIARGLVSMFSEDSGGSPVPGLFGSKDTDYPDASTDYDSPEIINGLAGLITVNQAAIDDPNKLRDGSIVGDSVNTEDASGFSTLLNQYVAAFETTRDFDPSAKIGDSATILDYSTDSVGWAEEYRSGATNASETTTAMLSRATEAYSNTTGVNLDEELILLLDVEQSYKAASKLLSTIDDMLSTLMEAAN